MVEEHLPAMVILVVQQKLLLVLIPVPIHVMLYVERYLQQTSAQKVDIVQLNIKNKKAVMTTL